MNPRADYWLPYQERLAEMRPIAWLMDLTETGAYRVYYFGGPRECAALQELLRLWGEWAKSKETTRGL